MHCGSTSWQGCHGKMYLFCLIYPSDCILTHPNIFCLIMCATSVFKVAVYCVKCFLLTRCARLWLILRKKPVLSGKNDGSNCWKIILNGYGGFSKHKELNDWLRTARHKLTLAEVAITVSNGAHMICQNEFYMTTTALRSCMC